MVMQKGMTTMAKTKRPAGYLLVLPDEMMSAAKMVSQTRGESLADYIRSAVRAKLIFDGADMESTVIQKLIRNATEPLSKATNFAAVHASATLVFCRVWARELFVSQGLPDDLARQKAAALYDTALNEALATFEDPKSLSPFGWIERPEESNLPDWLTDDANDQTGGDP